MSVPPVEEPLEKIKPQPIPIQKLIIKEITKSFNNLFFLIKTGNKLIKKLLSTEFLDKNLIDQVKIKLKKTVVMRKKQVLGNQKPKNNIIIKREMIMPKGLLNK